MQQQNLIRIFKKLIQEKQIHYAALIAETKEFSLNYEIDTILQHEQFDNNSTDNPCFQIGSVTKIFTAFIAANLILKKSLHLTTTLGDVLTGTEIDDTFKKINVCQLLTHTSGLPRLPDNFMAYCLSLENPYLNYGEEQLLEYLQIAKASAPSKRMEYSNLGYGILGYLLEKVTNDSYQELLSQNICSLFNMKRTFVYSNEMSLVSMMDGYTIDDIQTPAWDMNILKAAGGIISTSSDMQNFLKGLLYEATNNKELINLSLSSLNNEMAYGWIKRSLIPQIFKPDNTLWHNGMTGGFASYIQLNKEKKNGFVILLNKAINPDFIINDPLFNESFE